MTYKASLFASVTGPDGTRFSLSKTGGGEAHLCSISPNNDLTKEVVVPLEALRALVAQIAIVFPDAPTTSLPQRRRRRAVQQDVAVTPAERSDGRSIDRRTGEVIE